ncbi:MBL fold metallo-hydrolase [Solirubrobacter soli]|uniref:MBL fold metallo-hydrolase n=1 Tax=Solirubrobacter soli TaxID=363832 RepID=UPI00041D2C0E|nr:MBL fold metallo-hydrolase [Solirubrobacter soli]
MRVEWFGQSTFRLTAGDVTVVVDPFGDVSGLAARGLQYDYPPMSDVTADVLLVTHEHRDHNAVEVVGGSPHVIRSSAGTFSDTPVGEVVGVASEHDPVAGTQRGANVMYAFELDGLRVAHLGDLGQSILRGEQAVALGQVDLLFVPVGGGPTIGSSLAFEIASTLGARWVVPMHYRTHRLNFLETADAFLERFSSVSRPGASFELSSVSEGAVAPAAP